MAIDVGEQERLHRREMWERLRAAGGPKAVAPSVLRELGIYGGQQGIWVDKARTAGLTEDRTGVTVGLLHTGSSYADDLAEDGVVYHYPSTQRAGRDAAEVAATKAAHALHLPVFVITYPSREASTRDVHLGWIQDWEDATRLFLVAFSEEQPPPRPATGAPEEAVFVLTEQRRESRREVAARFGQARFKFDVLRRYRAQCAVCDLRFWKPWMRPIFALGRKRVPTTPGMVSYSAPCIIVPMPDCSVWSREPSVCDTGRTDQTRRRLESDTPDSTI